MAYAGFLYLEEHLQWSKWMYFHNSGNPNLLGGVNHGYTHEQLFMTINQS